MTVSPLSAGLSADLRAPELTLGAERLTAASSQLDVRVGTTLDVFAREAASLATADFKLKSGGDAELMVLNTTKVTTSGLTLDAVRAVEVSAAAFNLRASETITAEAEGELTVTAGNLALSATDGVEIMSLSGADLVAAKDVTAATAGAISLSADDDFHLATGGAFVLDARAAVDVSTSDATLNSDATVRALVADAAILGAETISLQAARDISGSFGGLAEFTVGGDINVRGNAAARFSTVGALSAAVASVDLQATEEVDITSSSLSLVGGESVVLETHGAALRMVKAAASDSQTYVWTKPAYFDEAEVMLDRRVEAVDRLWIEKGGILSPAARRSDGTSTAIGKVYLDLYSAEQQRWVTVWSAPVLTDLLDFHGLSIKFNEQDVAGVRFRSLPHSYSTFLNFDNTVMNFGTNFGGIFEVEAQQYVAIASGELLDLSAADLGVSATDSLEIAAGGLASVTAKQLELIGSDSVTVKSENIASFATADISAFAGRQIGLTATDLVADAFNEVVVTSAGAVRVATKDTELVSTGAVDIETATLELRAEQRVGVVAGAGASLAAASAEVAVGGSVRSHPGLKLNIPP